MMSSSYDTKRIRVLDGIRAIAILIIVWYHFWQQNWIIPNIGFVNLDFIPRYGFLFVDMMILLSSFCLFIPYARSMVYKEEIPNTKKFYIKRIARIVPSYYIALIISLLFLVFTSKLTLNGFFVKDTLMHIFFINNWSIDTLIASNYCGVLWTVALEVQFYLIFPFIAKKFMKKPILTYLIMITFGIICTYFISQNVNNSNISLYANHFLTFIPVYANGMLACWFYIKHTKNKKRKKSSDLIFSIISILILIVYAYLCKTIKTGTIQIWQINNRFMLSLLFSLFIISTCLASSIYQKIFSNKFMSFIAEISFNLYIYHQFIAVKLKEFRIPFYAGRTPPNMTGDSTWQWTYTIICIVISLVVAVLMTYLIEKPIAKYIRRKYNCDKKGI